jgi:hypothetical protein
MLKLCFLTPSRTRSCVRMGVGRNVGNGILVATCTHYSSECVSWHFYTVGTVQNVKLWQP